MSDEDAWVVKRFDVEEHAPSNVFQMLYVGLLVQSGLSDHENRSIAVLS